LFTQAERAFILKNLNVDYIEKYNFNAGFMAQTPEAFFIRLINDFNVKAIMIGEGYRFGKNRTGTAETIKSLAKKNNINAIILPCVNTDSNKNKISTSDIRGFLSAGSLTEAEDLLGFPFFICGKVAHGKKIGKKLGFPTVNIIPAADKFLPKDGVYTTQVHRNGEIIKGVTNIGLRPSFDDGIIRTVETFLLDFNGEMYGEDIRIDLKHYLRPEKKFENLEDLKTQIEKDVEQTCWNDIC
jgi:riboflavin kinase/FMN adenylyltransferase